MSLHARLVISMCAMLMLGTVPAHAQQKKLVPAPDIIPPATEAMQHPEFWISRIDDPDRIIMTSDQIRRLNESNRTRPLTTTDINGQPYSIERVVDHKDVIGVQFHLEDPLAITSFDGDELRARFGRARDYLLKRTFWDRRHLPFTDAKKAELIELTNEDAIPDVITPRYGILVLHTLNRVMPTGEAGYYGQYAFNDALQSTAMDIGMPVAILHRSADGTWLYVKSELAYGWVPAVNVAEASVRDIRRLAEPDDFVVAIDHRVPVYGDEACTAFLAHLYLGERVPLVKNDGGGCRVFFPMRDEKGRLNVVNGWIRKDAAVSEGYQPFTQRNVLETVFRLLYRPYGWADSENERDCCGMIRSVLRTFGIMTPRWTTHELHSANHVAAFPKDTPNDVKYSYLEKCEPGITVCGHGGHIVMYLGEADGVHYVIHQSGYSYFDDDTEYRVGRVIVNDTSLDAGSIIDDWTEISTFKP